jgi:hypothetical protein
VLAPAKARHVINFGQRAGAGSHSINPASRMGHHQTRTQAGTMCDYSLQDVRSRPAAVGDNLVTYYFGRGTRGFAASENLDMAVRCHKAGRVCKVGKVAQVKQFNWTTDAKPPIEVCLQNKNGEFDNRRMTFYAWEPCDDTPIVERRRG